MAPSASKANYKSYEAQARLVRAIVAAHPTTKWNYKEIAACYGSDMTEHALNHRFRHIKAQAKVINTARKFNLDIKDLTADESALPKSVGGVDKDNIAKYFGQSTADGIQFQFRTIKKDADRLRATADNGGDPSTCLDLGAGSGSGPSFTPTTTPKTPRSRTQQTPATAGGSTKRRAATTYVKIESDDEDDDGDSEATHNWSEMEETPSKRARMASATTPGQKNGTPSRLAAARANATIANVSAQLAAHTSESEAEQQTRAPQRAAAQPVATDHAARPSSLFATPPAAATGTVRNGVVKPIIQQPSFHPVVAPVFSASSPSYAGGQAFSRTGTDAFFGDGDSGLTDSLLNDQPGTRAAFYDDEAPVDGEF